jgi:hypothetical protein
MTGNSVDNQEEEKLGNVEDYHDFRQAYLKSLLDSVSRESIMEVWRIIPYLATKSYQHIIILKDGTHLCTCLLLVSHGIVCRHFFKLMVENQNALFHVMLMPVRWLQDGVWENVDSLYNEPFINACIQKSQNDNVLEFIPRHHDNIQEIQVRNCIQKKMEYGRIMGHFKKALNYSLEDDDQVDLDKIILAYIADKEAKREANTQLTNTDSNNVVKLSDGRVYNVDDIKDPLVHHGKGRPPNKRLKAFNEEVGVKRKHTNVSCEKGDIEVNGNIGGRKCGICHKTGHYAPKCPSKENVKFD